MIKPCFLYISPWTKGQQTFTKPLIFLVPFCVIITVFTEVELIYNVVSLSGVQQSDSVTYNMCVYAHVCTHACVHMCTCVRVHVCMCVRVRVCVRVCFYKWMDVIDIILTDWQSCPTLCNPMDYTVYRILQARTLEWAAFPFSRGSSQPRDRTQVSHIAGRFFTSWVTRGAQEYWSG